jgi:hypothetical protein
MCAGGVEFERLDLPSLTYSPAAGILVLQGMLLQHFFPPDVQLVFTNPERTVAAQGPFLLLRARLSDPWDVPLRLISVTLAKVLTFPGDMAQEQLQALLLGAVSE